MNPDPSIKNTCLGTFAALMGASGSLGFRRRNPLLQVVTAGTIRADNATIVIHVQVNVGVAERSAATVASDGGSSNFNFSYRIHLFGAQVY